jgi:hypothetical protein
MDSITSIDRRDSQLHILLKDCLLNILLSQQRTTIISTLDPPCLPPFSPIGILPVLRPDSLLVIISILLSAEKHLLMLKRLALGLDLSLQHIAPTTLPQFNILRMLLEVVFLLGQ